MKTNIPMVSIITPVHNSENFIRETIKSVQMQSFSNWELILINDCSTDSSKKIIDVFALEDERIKVINMDLNVGAAIARNEGIKVSQGRFIAFLDSDDLWFEDKLEYQINFMLNNNCNFTFSSYEKIRANGEVIGSVGVPARVTYKQLLKMQVIGCLTAVYDVSFFGKVYMPEIRKRQDWGLWLRLLKKTEYAVGIEKKMGQYRVTKDSLSSNKLNSAIYSWKLFRDVENFNLFKSFFYFCNYAITSSLRAKWPSMARHVGFLK